MADRIEGLLRRLPGPIRKPVEREWRPLRELFLSRRAPRLLLLGSEAEAFAGELASPGATLSPGFPYRFLSRPGGMRIAVAGEDGRLAHAAVADAMPDCVLLASGSVDGLAILREVLRLFRERQGSGPSLPVVAFGPDPQMLAEVLHGDAAASAALVAILPAGDREAVLAAVARTLPVEARLEFARATGERGVQREIARTVTRSTAAICTAIGAQPIPLADLPILTALQALMVAGILYASGREWSLATGRDFLAAAGVNVGAAFLFREGARAAVKFFPGWGNAVSGAVAGAGTYTIGLAATGYFIDGLPMEEARKKLKRLNGSGRKRLQ